LLWIQISGVLSIKAVSRLHLSPA